MKKILVSWNALKNDFIKDDGGANVINSDGPHVQLYEQGSDYEKHYLLSTSHPEQPDVRLEILANHLSGISKTEVIPVCMGINDPISVPEIKQKAHEFLLGLTDFAIEVFISPGTPAMQTAWYLIGREFKFDIRLFQVRPQHRRKNKEPIQEYFEFEESNYVESLVIREQFRKPKNTQDIFRTDSNKPVFDLADKIALTNRVTTLILGNTGTGKEVVANYIHEVSSRKDKPFRAINCSAFHDDLLESRLFGHVVGAFTGATKEQQGEFHAAHGGTIFLDEIGDISSKMQQTLLRVLEQREISKVGSQKVEKIDVRVIAATNQHLWELVLQKKFRADLYFRLAVAEITLPTLQSFTKKEKRDAVNFLLSKAESSFGRQSMKLSKEAWEKLYSYSFPGNFRELINMIERWFTYCQNTVGVRDFPERIGDINASLKLVDAENAHIQKVLNLYPGNKKRVYETLGISYNTLMHRVKNFNLIVPS